MRAALLKAFALVLALATPAAAQDYPSKPLRLIIPFAPGGSVDIVARLAATKLGERLGKQVLAENRAGAGGVIGVELAIAAPPDGHTLVLFRWRTPSIRTSTSFRSTPPRRSPSSLRWATARACSPSTRRCRRPP